MSQKVSLLDNSSDSEVELTINKDYAKRYDHWRNKEELQKYKDLKKDEEDSESSSESDEEIPEFDEQFFRGLSLLKGKDPRIYDKNFQLFQDQEVVKKPKVKKEKPIFMKDYERKFVLERGGKFSDEEEDNFPGVPTYSEEQDNLKMSFKEALGDSDNSDCDADDLFQVRTKTGKEKEEEESDYVKWLKGEEKELSEDAKKDMLYLRNYWNDPKLDENEKFLRDYILNKRYLEKDESEVPTYEELTSGMLSDDEKMIAEQEDFEHKYNFRYEEPDEEFIKRYPRTVGDSLRRVDNRRKHKREEKTERKKKEREQMQEELKRLKALKRKEIEEKFLKLKEVSGQDDINLNESDMESDFDPDKHDKKMQEMFNNEYYEIEEEKKPEFPYDEELDSENWNAWTAEKNVEEYEDEDIGTDDEKEQEEKNKNESNINPKEAFANEMINAARPKKKMKKKSLFAKIISQQKPLYDPDGKSYEEYLDEYYKLDFEDVIGDMPVRYKYRNVVPNDFGLTVDEIFTADDKELNRWCSVKKTCQYRNDDEELYDVQAFRKKAENPYSKKKILASVYDPKDADDFIADEESSKTEGKLNQEARRFYNSPKKVNNQGNSAHCSVNKSVEETVGKNQEFSVQNDHINQSKKKKKKKAKLSFEISENVADSTNSIQNSTDIEQGELQSSQTGKKYKKKKHTEKQILDLEMECENSNVKNESSSMVETKQKSSKRKRKDSLLGSDSEIIDDDSAAADFSSKSEELSTQTIDLINSNSNIVSEEPSKKKKKKKKNKRKRNADLINSGGHSEGNKSNSFRHKFQYNYNKFASEDKRLGLSDERLAAYGINPKKFKNKIIYSKK